MPQLGDTSKAPYQLIELDADGNPASPLSGDVITVVSSDTASLTVVPDSVPAAGTMASGFLVGGKKLGQVTVTFTVTHQQSSNPPLVTVLTIDVVAGAAVSLSVTLGTPVAQ